LLLRRRAFSSHYHYLVHRYCAVPDLFVAGVRQLVGPPVPVRLSHHDAGGDTHTNLARVWPSRNKIRDEHQNSVANDRRWSGSEYNAPCSGTPEGIWRSSYFLSHRGESCPIP